MDLKDLLGASIGQISFILMLASIGSMVGSSLAGILLDRLTQYKYLILAGEDFI